MSHNQSWMLTSCRCFVGTASRSLGCHRGISYRAIVSCNRDWSWRSKRRLHGGRCITATLCVARSRSGIGRDASLLRRQVALLRGSGLAVSGLLTDHFQAELGLVTAKVGMMECTSVGSSSRLAKTPDTSKVRAGKMRNSFANITELAIDRKQYIPSVQLSCEAWIFR